MLYLAIPAHNEVATIGVLLWRLRSVLAEFPREYEVVVYDDASTDETADVAEQYVQTMPVTVLRGTKSVGYAGAVDALIRHVSGQTRYPRRDALLLLQGDFTDPPGIVPEFARRFEGGADLVIGERTAVVDAPTTVRRLFAAAGWALRPFVRIDGVKDLTSSMRLIRVSVLRDALRSVGDVALCDGDSWTANADLLLQLVPHARRVESVLMEPTYGVRMRDSRRVTMRDALAALRWGWRARGRRAVPTTAPEPSLEQNPRAARGNASPRRREEPEVTVDRLRERTRDRGRGDSSLEEAPTPGRRDRPRTRDTTKERDARPVGEPQRSKREDEEELRPSTRPARASAREVLSADEAALTDPFAAPNAAGRPRKPRAATPVTTTPAPAPPTAATPTSAPFAVPPASPREPEAASAANAATPREPVAVPSARTAPPRDPTAPSSDAGTTDDAGHSVVASMTASHNTGGDLVPAPAPTGARDDDRAVAAGDEDTRDRKRRRNRRSRRRKSKSGNGAASAVGDDDASRDTDSADDRNDAPSDNATGTNGADNEGSPASRGASTNDAADSTTDAATTDATVDAETRSRRRGRRGRRGGARRARGRGRDGGGGSDSPESAPPSSDSVS